MDIRFLMGLPGSGKTSYAKELVENSYNYKRIVDLDYIFKFSKTKEEREKKIISNIKREIRSHPSELILDSLILTKEDVKYFYDLIHKITNITKVIIDIWNPDKEQCIINDLARGRETLSKETILNINFIPPTQKEFIELFDKKVFLSYFIHEVYRTPKYEEFFTGQGIKMNKKYMESDYWSLGGTGHNWNGESYKIDPEPQPINFKEFDDLLFKLCPDISFLLYKKLYNETVDIYEYNNNDYYSDTMSAKYRCNLEKLYELLEKYNLIKEE